MLQILQQLFSVIYQNKTNKYLNTSIKVLTSDEPTK